MVCNRETIKSCTVVYIPVVILRVTYPANMQDRAMLAISWQGWQNVGKFANALPMLPMFCQHLCKRRNYCSSKFPRIFLRLCNDSGPFSFTYSFPICQKYFFFITIQPTLVEYWLNIGCQHRHYAFQPIQGQRWMPAPGQHWWIKFFLTTDNFL